MTEQEQWIPRVGKPAKLRSDWALEHDTGEVIAVSTDLDPFGDEIPVARIRFDNGVEESFAFSELCDGTPHICEFDGCTSLETDRYEYPVPEDGVYPSEWLCAEHAVEQGFCYGCGGFFAGTESYDFSPVKGLCYDCRSELDEPEGEGDADYYDFYTEGWVDADSDVSDMEPDETPRGRYIGPGSEYQLPEGGEA